MNDEIRVGHGWDVHAFGGSDRRLVIGGVEVEHDRGLLGHSDADVLLHALTDALLGAAALGDIGEHYPDSDPQFEGIDSRVMLRHIRSLIGDAGWNVINADTTVIAEAPKLHPYKEAIQRSIAELLQVEPTSVGVKAKSAERLGPVGRREGIEAHAVVLLTRERVELGMTLRLYDTLTKKKREFVPLEPGVVKMYNCGPTVYGYAHIGNFRSFLFADVLRRYLEYRGLRVHQVMNITDVGHLTEDDLPSGAGDDKLEAEAARQGKTPWDIARFYTRAFFDDLRFLRLREADVYPEATKHIPEMIRMIEQLVGRGHAYESNGSVYFDVSSFPDYGRLSGNTLEDLDAGSRVEVLSEKRHPHDFALWKRDPQHLMQWDSPWGRGFPGWHIECSAMARRYLGVTFDIHTGGEDNIFPHHECEIAQSVSANDDEPFVNYWVHARHLLVDGEKMSKRKGTFHLLSDLRDRGHSAEAIRHAFTSTHYGTPQNFTWESMEASVKAIERLNAFCRNLDANPKAKDRPDVAALAADAKRSFDEAMADDLNSSAAFAAVFELVNGINRLDGGLSRKDVDRVRSLLKAFDSVFVFLREETPDGTRTARKIEPAEVDQLIAQRNAARAKGDFALADEIRDGLLKKGVVLEDGDRGTRWHWS